jgi:hypothetical protein
MPLDPVVACRLPPSRSAERPAAKVATFAKPSAVTADGWPTAVLRAAESAGLPGVRPVHVARTRHYAVVTGSGPLGRVLFEGPLLPATSPRQRVRPGRGSIHSRLPARTQRLLTFAGLSGPHPTWETQMTLQASRQWPRRPVEGTPRQPAPVWHERARSHHLARFPALPDALITARLVVWVGAARSEIGLDVQTSQVCQD